MRLLLLFSRLRSVIEDDDDDGDDEAASSLDSVVVAVEWNIVEFSATFNCCLDVFSTIRFASFAQPSCALSSFLRDRFDCCGACA